MVSLWFLPRRARFRLTSVGFSTKFAFTGVHPLGSPFGRAVTAKSHKKAAVLPYPTHSGRTACPFCRLFTSDKRRVKKLLKLFYCQIKKTKCEGRTKKHNKNDRKCSKFAPCFFVQFWYFRIKNDEANGKNSSNFTKKKRERKERMNFVQKWKILNFQMNQNLLMINY